MSALAPGLYRATVRGVANRVVMVGGRGDFAQILDTDSVLMASWGSSSKDITDARLLTVIEIGTWFPHRAAAAIEALQGVPLGMGHNAFLVDVLEQITAQEKPARIEEPGVFGVVKAGYSDWDRGTWIHVDDVNLWRGTGATVTWDRLIDPTLIRDGVA